MTLDDEFFNKIDSLLEENDLCIKHDRSMKFVDVVSEIHDYVLNHKFEIKNPIGLIGRLLRLKSDFVSRRYQQTKSAISRLRELNTEGFIYDDEIIKYSKYIPIELIKTKGQIYTIDSSLLKEMGVGIFEFWIRNSNRILNVYCEGQHPNVHPETKIFCLGMELKQLMIDLNSMMMIREALSQVNLDYAYDSYSKELIKGVVHGQRVRRF